MKIRLTDEEIEMYNLDANVRAKTIKKGEKHKEQCR